MQFFLESDLVPKSSANTLRREAGLLSDAELDDLREFASRFAQTGRLLLPKERLEASPHLRTFIAMGVALGALSTSDDEDPEVTWVSGRGRLARHLPQILAIYLAEGFSVVDDWHRTHLIPEDRLSAMELLHQMELRRVEQSLRRGTAPAVLAERPVAYGVLHARNAKGQSCFLFETNKDWHRLNLIGGKQEPEDCGDYSETLRREIGEELGISSGRLRLIRLNEHPLHGYSLSGNAGSLAHYPCVLFGVTVQGRFRTRLQDRWLTEEAIHACADAPDSPLMVNPIYLRFLLEGRPSRLAQCPLTTDQQVKSTDPHELLSDREPVMERWGRVLRENKDLFAAVLTIMAAILTLIGLAKP